MNSEIEMIDLVDIASEDDFSPLLGPGEDGFDLMGSQVLGLIDDLIHFPEAAASNINQGFNGQIFPVEHLLQTLKHLTLFGKLIANDAQIVIKRLHIRLDFRLDISRQVLDILIGKRDHRTGEQNLAKLLPALQGRSQGKQCLAGARLAGNRDEFDA